MRKEYEEACQLSNSELSASLLEYASNAPEFWQHRDGDTPVYRLLHEHVRFLREWLTDSRPPFLRPQARDKHDSARLCAITEDLQQAEEEFHVMTRTSGEGRDFWQILLLEALRRLEWSLNDKGSNTSPSGEVTPHPGVAEGPGA